MNKRRKIVGIAKDTLDFILEVSKSNHPREFIGMLCADEFPRVIRFAHFQDEIQRILCYSHDFSPLVHLNYSKKVLK